jgi:hypothetical protein
LSRQNCAAADDVQVCKGARSHLTPATCNRIPPPPHPSSPSLPPSLAIRSAKRSVPAARAATAEGYTACVSRPPHPTLRLRNFWFRYNISFGFLGVLDKATGEGQRRHACVGQFFVLHDALARCCTSHVTRHTSHVTRHTSHVTRHTSHVTRHTSHAATGQYHGGWTSDPALPWRQDII